MKNRVAIVAALRTPFSKAGTDLANVHVTDLAAEVMKAVLYRANWPANAIDEVILGNVIMPADAANPARIAALKAGLPESVPALTVQRNCASGMEAIIQAARRIQSGESEVILAGGAESMSSSPLLFPQEAIPVMTRLSRAKNIGQKLKIALSLRPRHFKPRSALMMGLTDPFVDLIMGKTAEILANEFNITREKQDSYSLDSHVKASKADFSDRIVPMYVGKNHAVVKTDNGPRENQSIEALRKLKPIFDKKYGSVTVGNSCQITDGAAMLLLMSESIVKAKGLEPLGFITEWSTAACDPARMGLGPVYAIDRLIKEILQRPQFRQAKVMLEGFDIIEINEAFAAQVLACELAMVNNKFCRDKLGRQRGSREMVVGQIDPHKLNPNGGSIALGHPVGATGARIVMDVAYELKNKDKNIGLASLCVGGGQGSAVVVERH